jgi:phosphoribosylglycinamide formyltransferase-1
MSLEQIPHSHINIRLGVLLSGRGSNFAAIQQAIEHGQLSQAEVVVVISNHADAAGLAWAKSRGLNTVALEKAQFENRQAFDQALAETLQACQVDLVILAGYDRILGAAVLSAYPGRILNIHPSLLPAYGGKGMVGHKVHQAVLENGETESGCTVHLVTELIDGGTVLGQTRISVQPDDTIESLAARVLAEEHRLYSRMIGEFICQAFPHRLTTKNKGSSHEPETLSDKSLA